MNAPAPDGLPARSWLPLMIAIMAIASACGDRGHASGVDANPRTSVNTSETTMPHADHRPRHEGVVLMHGDLHYEAVLRPAGRYQVYFSDAARAPLPATIASSVTITITGNGDSPEIVPLRIADDGESWNGNGKPVTTPDATARIAYEMDGKMYWIDIPFKYGFQPSQ